MALGVADHVWTIGELLDAAPATPQRRLLALPGCLLRRSKSSVIESAADDLPASSAPPPPLSAHRKRKA